LNLELQQLYIKPVRSKEFAVAQYEKPLADLLRLGTPDLRWTKLPILSTASLGQGCTEIRCFLFQKEAHLVFSFCERAQRIQI